MKLSYFVKESLTNLKRNKLMTTAATTTVMISLFIFGFFLLIIINLNRLANNVAEKVEIVAHLKEGLSKDEIKTLSQQIFNLPEVNDVKFVSKDEALAILQERLGEKIKLEDVIVDNPLPNSFKIKVNDETKIPDIVKKLRYLENIDEVVYPQELLPKLISISNIVQIGGFVIILSLATGSTFLIMNAIRLTVFARRKEIRIMQLVGATDWFIRLPYLFEGIIQGFVGATLAVIIIIIGYGYLYKLVNGVLPFVSLINSKLMLFNLSLVIILFGIFLGIIGSLIALTKFLQEV